MFGFERRLRPTLIALAAACAACAAEAASAGPLAEQMRAASAEIATVQASEVHRAQSQLAEALNALDAHLAAQATGPSWTTWLRLEELHQQLQAEAPDIELLSNIGNRFRGLHAGLEYTALRNTRTELENYVGWLRAASEPATPEEAAAHLEQLATLVEQYEHSAAGDLHARIAEEFAWLAKHRVADHLLNRWRPYLSHPNVYFVMQGTVISDWTRDRAERDVDVNRREGKQITTGRGRLEGYSAVFPVPSEPGRGKLEIRFSGTLRTNVTTHQGPVHVRTHGIAPIEAVRPVVATAEGLVAGEPAIFVQYHNFLDGVSTQFRRQGLLDKLVRRIATNAVHRDRAEIERDAARGAQKQFDESFREEVAQELQEGNEALLNRLRNPLLRQDLYPRRFEFHTSHEALDVKLLFDATSRLGAPHAPPAFAVTPAIGVRLHESCIDNLAGQALAGRLLMVNELERLINDAIPRALQPESPEASESDEGLGSSDLGIEFATERPISATFDDNLVTVTVRGTRYVFEERTYPPMNIIVGYRLHQQQGTLRATREGEPEYVAPPGVGGLRVIALRRILRSHINPRLEPEYVRDEVRLPDSDGEDEVGPLEFAEAAAQRGWLLLNLIRKK